MNKSISKYMSEIGKKGGSVTSEAKKKASRENGKKHVTRKVAYQSL